MKKTIPLYLGERGDPNRRLIGHAVVDDATDVVGMQVTDKEAQRMLGGISAEFSISSIMPPHTVLAPGWMKKGKDEQQEVEASEGHSGGSPSGEEAEGAGQEDGGSSGEEPPAG